MASVHTIDSSANGRGGTVFCLECGAAVSADSKFCKECGAKLTAAVRSSTLTAEDLQPVIGEVNQERLTKLLDMAFWHNDNGNVESAILAGEAALKINPSSTTAHSLLSNLFEKKGDDEQALRHLEAVMALNPDSTADMVRLEQLKRGVHAKAISPPPGYRWVPPALSGLTLAGLRERVGLDSIPTKPANPQLVPVYYSTIAIALVLGAGIVLMRGYTGLASPTRPVSKPVIMAAAPTPTMQQPFPLSTPTQVEAPTVYPPPTESTHKKGPVDLGDTPDPFGSARPATQAETDSLFPELAGPSAAPKPAGDLPNLKAVPIPGSNNLAPATISVTAPDGETARPISAGTPDVSLDNLPRHTVEVSGVGGSDGLSSAPQQSVYPANANQPTGGTSQVASAPDPSNAYDPGTIHVSVHEPSASEMSATDGNQGSEASLGAGQKYEAASRSEGASSGAPAINVDEGQAYQQYALSLQEQGDYKGAKAAYERAIRSYTDRLRSGHDTDDVQRGLKACKTGLEICQQSLQ